MNQEILNLAYDQFFAGGAPRLKRGCRQLFVNQTSMVEVINDINNRTFCELIASGTVKSMWFLWKHENRYFIVSCSTIKNTFQSFYFSEINLNLNGTFDEIVVI